MTSGTSAVLRAHVRGRLWGSCAASDDGAATAASLGVIHHIHPAVGAIDVVDVRLSLVPVTNFCEGDQLQGLALRKQLAKKKTSVFCSSHSPPQKPSVAPSCLQEEAHALELPFWPRPAF